MIKWLVRLGSAVGLLLIVFVGVMLLLGGGGRALRTEARIDIARPAAVVFPWLVEGPKLHKWVSGLESFEPQNSEPQVGQKVQMVLVRDGHRYEVTREFTAYTPPTLLQVQLEHSEFSDQIEYTLVEHDGATTLTERSTAHYKDLLYRLLVPLLSRDTERSMNESLATLKALVETDPMPIPPHPLPGQKGFHGCCAPEPEHK
ncbi:MAG TPA: SRPBCC family protein [Pseudomonadota bacterium]|jgi:uncharacterized protein YndB with AHSA1/START domain|nr:SRPBCC family protein [Pseudomonadota bacterium]